MPTHNAIDMVGKKFGRLTVLAFSHRDRVGKKHWLCRCYCGKEFTVRGNLITTESTKSCGCSRTMDITGQRFGRLVALHKTERRYANSVVWKCKCDCGNDAYVAVSRLRAKATRSCGCLRREVAKTYLQLPDGVAAMRTTIHGYKGHARNRGHSYELTEEEFKSITQLPCYYCGIEPLQTTNPKNNSASGPYIYNGIDRVDNTKGYTMDNCVPACKVCNWMKRQMIIEDFIAHIEKISKHYKSKVKNDY